MMYTLGKVLVFMTAPLSPAVRSPVSHTDGLRGAWGARGRLPCSSAVGRVGSSSSTRGPGATPRLVCHAPRPPHALLAPPVLVLVFTEYARLMAASPQLVPALLRLTAPALDPSRCVCCEAALRAAFA
jgi:hypothetical protein